MDLADIVTVSIDNKMYEEAENEANFLRTKIGKNTRPATNKRDIIGSLAHQAVEKAIDTTSISYTSYRTTKYERCDSCDIICNEQAIDVKGTKGQPHAKYFYREQFLVFANQVESTKFDLLDQLCFVQVDLDNMDAYIYGFISTHDFKEKAEIIGPNDFLRWKNYGIRARFLTPFHKFIYRA